MFEYIKGILVCASPLKITIEAGGMGYRIHIPVNVYPKLPPLGAEIVVYLSQVIREDAQRLFGFLNSTEKELFELLNQISGVGPKIAIALIGHMEVGQLMDIVTIGNHALLSKIPGIGKKIAERLIMELRDKLKHLELPTQISTPPSLFSDALGALIHLGYNPVRAQQALKKVLSTQDAEQSIKLSDLITAALRCL